MKKICLIILFLNAVFGLKAFDFKDETLKYVISYKWGLIHKDAGEATLKLRNNGAYYDIILTGKTKPWADNFYSVRDTLKGKIEKSSFRPVYYEKVAHENKKYSKDVINYSFSGNLTEGKVKRYKQDKKGKINLTEKLLQAQGKTFDMASIFYFLRTLDYKRLSGGGQIKTMMFSGSKVEELSVRCLGTEKIKLNKKEYQAYHIKFKFTTEGKKKSSDDIDTWISVSSPHVPLLVVGQLPVGQIKCSLKEGI